MVKLFGQVSSDLTARATQFEALQILGFIPNGTHWRMDRVVKMAADSAGILLPDRAVFFDRKTQDSGQISRWHRIRPLDSDLWPLFGLKESPKGGENNCKIPLRVKEKGSN